MNRNLTERGFIEVVDICFPPKVHGGGLLPDESRLKEWADLLVEATTACGCPIDSAKSHKSQLQAAGFVDIVEDTKYWPQNRWPKAKEYKELGIFYFILPRGTSTANINQKEIGLLRTYKQALKATLWQP